LRKSDVHGFQESEVRSQTGMVKGVQTECDNDDNG
jgi:hypothetical protein